MVRVRVDEASDGLAKSCEQFKRKQHHNNASYAKAGLRVAGAFLRCPKCLFVIRMVVV